MEQQTEANEVKHAHGGAHILGIGLSPHDKRQNEQGRVDHECGRGVQWVDADGTPIRIVDRGRQQVVDVDNHGRNHNHRRAAPAAPVERERSQQRDHDVQSDMDHFCVVGRKMA